MDTFYLFAQPSFFTGAARLVDPFGLFDAYNYSLTGELADELALRLDMKVLGDDARQAIERFLEEVESGRHPRQLELLSHD